MKRFRYGVLRALWALGRDGYLRENGWFRSFRERAAVNAAGEPIPWLNYSFVTFFQDRLSADLTFFEFGCGNSTIFWSRRVKRVEAVEHDGDWFRLIQPALPQSAECVLATADSAYEHEIKRRGHPFDVVIVDGIRRAECVAVALSCLSARGVLVLDDSFRPEYQEIFSRMKQAGFRHLEISGAMPIQNHRGVTALFYRDGNCLGL